MDWVVDLWHAGMAVLAGYYEEYPIPTAVIVAIIVTVLGSGLKIVGRGTAKYSWRILLLLIRGALRMAAPVLASNPVGLAILRELKKETERWTYRGTVRTACDGSSYVEDKLEHPTGTTAIDWHSGLILVGGVDTTPEHSWLMRRRLWWNARKVRKPLRRSFRETAKAVVVDAMRRHGIRV